MGHYEVFELKLVLWEAEKQQQQWISSNVTFTCSLKQIRLVGQQRCQNLLPKCKMDSVVQRSDTGFERVKTLKHQKLLFLKPMTLKPRAGDGINTLTSYPYYRSGTETVHLRDLNTCPRRVVL